MNILLIGIAMFLTASVATRLYNTLLNYKKSALYVALILTHIVEILALGFIFYLLF